MGAMVTMLFQNHRSHESPSADLRAALRQIVKRDPGSDVRVGVGGEVAATEAKDSYEQAELALRFAGSGQTGRPGCPGSVIDYADLGPIALLALIPGAELRHHGDLRSLERLVETESGLDDLAALEAFCRAGSLRSAAQALYIHHSTVAHRLARAANELGVCLDDPADRFRIQLALCARRLARGQLSG
jgi:sugar diacid utilization regulator